MAREAAENASSNGRLVVDTHHDGGHGDSSADDVAAADVNLDDGVDSALVHFCNSPLQLIACAEFPEKSASFPCGAWCTVNSSSEDYEVYHTYGRKGESFVGTKENALIRYTIWGTQGEKENDLPHSNCPEWGRYALSVDFPYPFCRIYLPMTSASASASFGAYLGEIASVTK